MNSEAKAEAAVITRASTISMSISTVLPVIAMTLFTVTASIALVVVAAVAIAGVEIAATAATAAISVTAAIVASVRLSAIIINDDDNSKGSISSNGDDSSIGSSDKNSKIKSKILDGIYLFLYHGSFFSTYSANLISSFFNFFLQISEHY